MSFVPLRAKLHRTTPAYSSIARPHLLQRLDEGVVNRVTLVSAPAGFGKSTLVSAWLAHLIASEATTAPQEVCKASWLSLDEADNQLPRFLNYLIAAIQESFPDSCRTLTALLQEFTTGQI